MNLVIEEHLKDLGVSLAYTVVEFENGAYSEVIWDELLKPLIAKVEENDSIEMIKDEERMIATKKVYRALGKDPARFRPSSDSLWRRVIQKKGLYQINNLVDANNYFSLLYKLPFGSYDLAKVGETITLSVGETGESYAGIGKKAVNIENLLVLKDEEGPFGSPTSDSTRGMIGEDTTQAVLIGYVFGDIATADMQQEIKAIVEKYLKDCRVVQQDVI
ncbi:B3/B4 domain-containing protein [Enterococcus sp. AZ072]|uniref:B3/B4 domain-containing protein n=1 Tax=unclassified Enterococcus TaxID=2608891 RepID=UPI003D2758B4